jgi:hypothetical protein
MIVTLFEECLEALGSSTEIIKDDADKNKIFGSMVSKFPLAFYGRIDWMDVSKKHLVSSLQELLSILEKKGKIEQGQIYIIWSDPTLPILKSTLENILKNFDDVEAVRPNTWIYSPSAGWVIEFYHDGDITLGFE